MKHIYQLMLCAALAVVLRPVLLFLAGLALCLWLLASDAIFDEVYE